MIRNHLKILLRNLSKRKGFTIINILGLSLGFACSLLVFLFVHHHLQFDNFHHNSDRIYRFNTEEHRDFIDYEASVPPGFANAFKEDYDYEEIVAKIVTRNERLVTVQESNEKAQYKVDVAFAEADLFRILNYPMLNDAERVPITEPNTAVITQQLAQKLFGAEDPVNRTFTLENQETILVTGVLKDLPGTTLIQAQAFISFQTLEQYDDFLSGEYWGGINSSLQCFALLRPDQNIEAIEEAIGGYVKKFRPNSHNVHHYKLQPLANIHFDARYSGGIDTRVLWIFSSIGLFILLIGCINFINISTAHSVYRSKEVGVRKVLGSFRNQLFWQFISETFLVVSTAFLVGVGLCMMALPRFNSIFGLDLAFSEVLNLPFLAFLVVLLMLVTLLAGSYPGLLLSRIAPILALKRKLTEKDAGGYLTRKTLVVVQFTISIVLIIGCVVVSKQLRYAINSDLGFDQTGVVMVDIPSGIGTGGLQALKSRIAQSSGVEKITSCFASPGAGQNSWGTDVRYSSNPKSEDFSIQIKAADSDYLSTFDLTLLAGRNFLEKQDTVDEVMVNLEFVRKIGASSPDEVLGQIVAANAGNVKGSIVGVIDDFHNQDFHANIEPVLIFPENRFYRELAVKINLTQARSALQHIEKEWIAQFPDYLFEYEFLDDRVAELYESEQRFLTLIGIFSGLAVLIGCLGVYGLILFFVGQKTKEIGIRKVLGGDIRHILVFVGKDFFKLITIAGVIAIPVAWYFMNQWLQDFQYKTDISWWIFVLAIGVVMTITLLSVSYQAIKAAMLNPVESLRAE